MSEVHIMYDGQTEDINLKDLFPEDRWEQLGIEPGTEITSDNITGEQIKLALVDHYDRPASEFAELVVEHHKNGNITVRPNATFGKIET